MGTLLIQRNKKFLIYKLIDTIRINLEKNTSVAFFPEGTTGNGLQHPGQFYSSLFKSVSFAEFFVQALAIQYRRQGDIDPIAPFIGSDNFVSHLFRIAMQAETTLLLYFTPPIYSKQMSRQELAVKTRENIIQVLNGRTLAQEKDVIKYVA